MRRLLIILLITLLQYSCAERKPVSENSAAPEIIIKVKPQISRELYYNKTLGMLLGSAIGDAMGAPTEMWSRRDILLDYGFVNSLDSMVRAPSAEGTWKYNLPAGGTTDDTRWKKLTIEYLLEEDLSDPNPETFARFVVEEYQEKINSLKATDSFEPEPFEENLMKMSWLQEWAMVAKPYADNDLQGYNDALHKFYGGEMSCAGMLYSPAIALAFPADPAGAYEAAFAFSIFDIGYARDMTALVSAMTSAAFHENASEKTVLNVNRNIDPKGYFKSRLVGRSAYRFYQHANNIRFETDALKLEDLDSPIEIPQAMRQMDPLEYARLRMAFDMLDQANEDVAFHPGEIYLITLTAMIFCDFDFEKSLAFIVNYGRDNDTVAAIAGAILGAYWGADKLPQKMIEQVIEVNKNELDIDLEQLATKMTEKYFE